MVINPVDLGGVDLVRWYVGDQATVAQPDYAIGKASGQLDLVQTDHGGDAILSADFAKHAQDADRGFRVKARHRLVGEDNVRLLSQGPGDPDPLLLAAAEAIRADHGF